MNNAVRKISLPQSLSDKIWKKDLMEIMSLGVISESNCMTCSYEYELIAFSNTKSQTVRLFVCLFVEQISVVDV